MSPSQVKWARFRLKLVFSVFLVVWGILIWRVANLQIHERDRLFQIAEGEYQRQVELRPVRGDILDRSGEKLAVSLRLDSIFAEPPQIEDPPAAAARLAKILKMNRRDLLERLTKKSCFVWLKRQVDPDQAEAVRVAGIPGVGMVKEGRRFYPNLTLAAQVLGFVGIDTQGLAGLEVAYENRLRGRTRYRLVERDALGRTFQDRLSQDSSNLKGASLTLTLDRRVQYIAETALDAAVKRHHARAGMAIVVRPSTGEVLALAIAPQFNPNDYGRYPALNRRNIALTNTFDPGSTFKVFLVAAALDEGVVRPDDKVDCENGAMAIGSRLVHDTHPYGLLTVANVVKYSSNIGAVKIGRRLSPERFFDYMNRFGYGEKTGIDLPGESKGLIRPPSRWREIDAANAAFGQGLTVTGLQLVMAMAALANDGVLMRPYLVARVQSPDGRIQYQARPQAVRQAVSPRTAAQLRLMLRSVVEQGGTGTLAEPEGYPAAGKTGTAQKLDPVSHQYSQTKFVSSFVGFLPYDRPELAILVSLDEPRPQYFGGVVAAPVFREIGQKVLPLLNVTPRPAPPVLASPDETSRAARTEARRSHVAGPGIKETLTVSKTGRSGSPLVALGSKSRGAESRWP